MITELGTRLERVRLERNLSQAQLARTAGVSEDSVRRLESGKNVQLVVFVRVLRALGMLDELDAAVPEPVQSPIDRVDGGGHQRQRASATRRSGSQWRWGTP